MEDYRIKRLVLNYVGVFEHLDLCFEKKSLKDKAEIHIFTGENGTGKTTLLEAMTYFDTCFNSKLNDYNRNIVNNNGLLKKLNYEFSDFLYYLVGVYFENSLVEYSKTWDGWKNKNIGYFEKYYKSGLKIPNAYGFFAYNGSSQITDTNVDAFKHLEFNPILEALSFYKTNENTNTNLLQWIANNKTRSALAYQKGDKNLAQYYLVSIQKIEQAISEIIDRKIEFVIEEYNLNIMVKLDEQPINFNTLANGYKSVISWLTDLIFRLDYMNGNLSEKKFTLFLDEIDINLHPKAQMRLLPVIQKLFPNAQIFITTHSPFVIGSVTDAWLYNFKLDQKGNSVLEKEPVYIEEEKTHQQIVEEVSNKKK